MLLLVEGEWSINRIEDAGQEKQGLMYYSFSIMDDTSNQMESKVLPYCCVFLLAIVIEVGFLCNT